MSTNERFPELPKQILAGLVSDRGTTFSELSAAAPVLMVFLRHLGCPFCRQTLGDLQAARPALEQLGIGIALVYMADDDEAGALFARYGLDDIPRFSDPRQELYCAFGLRRLSVGSLLDPLAWSRAGRAGIVQGHGFGRPKSDPLQLPGVFLIDEGHIVAGHTHVAADERPDYLAMVRHVFAPTA